MDVKFTTCPRAKLNELEIINGQIIYLADEDACFYDIANIRRAITGVRVVEGLPQTGQPGVIYVDIGHSPASMWLWDDGTNTWINLGGEYRAGTGLVLVDHTFNHKNAVTAGTAKGDDDKILEWEQPFTIPFIKYDSEGHVTEKGVTTMTMPRNPNTHWITRLYAGKDGPRNEATNNGETNLIITDDYAVRTKVNLVGSDIVKVTSDANGKVTIDGTGVSFEPNQGLTEQQKENARNNIGIAAGTGISLNNGTINHSNAVTAGTAKGSDTSTLSFGSSFNLPSVSYDAQGHVTSKGTTTLTLPSLGETSTTAYRGDRGKVAYDHASAKGSAFTSRFAKITTNSEGHVTSVTDIVKSDITALGIPGENTTYSAGTGLSLSGTTFNHSNSIAAGTAQGTGTKGLSFGEAFNLPTVSYDGQGHVNGKGTTTLTLPSLGESSTNAYYGDRGKVAYDHASAKGSAFSSGFYKITTNSEGHVTGASAVQKGDITALGIPGQDTTYSAGANITLSGTQFSVTKRNVTDALGYTPPTQDTTYSAGTGLNLSGTTFSAKMTGVKGNVESSYRDGNVNIAMDNICWIGTTSIGAGNTSGIIYEGHITDGSTIDLYSNPFVSIKNMTASAGQVWFEFSKPLETTVNFKAIIF